MQPYWRAESRRTEAFETTHGWIESRVGEAWLERKEAVVDAPRLRVLPRPVPAAPAFDAGAFAAAFEAALGASDAALASIARCGAFTISRGYGCGTERRATPGWCGSPVCFPCAEARAQAAGAVARGRWPDAPIVVADVFYGATGGTALPTAEQVVGARDAFARAARRLDLEGLARAVVTPDGVRFFAASAGADGALVARALERLLREAGLEGATVTAVDRREATKRLEDAITLEARRFRQAVIHDQKHEQRAGGGAKRAARWVSLARKRHKDARRATIAGGRGALPVPDARGPALDPAGCPTHGASCADTATIVRDAGGEVILRGKPLGARPTRQTFAKLAEQAATRGEERARKAG